MTTLTIRRSSLGIWLLLASCGSSDDAATAGAQGNLQAQQNFGGEVPEVVCEDDAGEPPPEEPPVEVDAGYEDCATPPPPNEFPDAGQPPNEFPDAGQPPTETPDGGSNPPPTVDCPQGGSTSAIAVQFACSAIDVASCKDLSNVVLEFADGTRQRFEGLRGTTGNFSGGQTIVRVWIKAGANASADGPGYGELFEAPAGLCD